MAVPNPEDELGRLARTLAKLPPVVLVHGASDFFRTTAVDRLIAAVPKDAELRVIDAGAERDGGGGGGDGDDDGEDTAPASDGDLAAGLAQCPELQDLRGGGLFAKVAFVVVRRGGGWWKKHGPTVAAAAAKFGKGCGLIVEGKKLDKRRKVVATFVKTLAEAGAVYEFRELYDLPWDRSRGPLDGELCKWVVARGRQLGVPLQPEAAWLLCAQVGKQPAELLDELERLRDRLGADGKRAPLAPADLRGKLTTSFESNPFELADAVLGGDRKAAFRSVRAMFDRGVRGKDGKAMDQGGVLPFATSWLFNQFAQLLEARQLLDSGMAPRDVATKAGVFQFPERFVERLQKLTQPRLRRGILALHTCQRSLRLTGEDPDVLLERFLGQWFDGAPIPTAEDLDL